MIAPLFVDKARAYSRLWDISRAGRRLEVPYVGHRIETLGPAYDALRNRTFA